MKEICLVETAPGLFEPKPKRRKLVEPRKSRVEAALGWLAMAFCVISFAGIQALWLFAPIR